MVDEIGSRLLYEDNHLILVNKRCGELVQGDKTGDQPLLETLREFIRIRDRKPGNVFLGLVHRLDRPTSGIVVFAKTSKALGRMNRLFAESRVEKRYWALTDALPPDTSGELRHFLQRDPKTNKSRAFSEPGSERKAASLGYEVLLSLDRYHLLELDLHSGRHHQIRAQLQAMGIHIRGDLKYGARRSNPTGGISLHARSISFEHPVGARETVKVVADPRPVQDDPLWKKLELYNSI
jgi:23S rRNA pseudouridine1911/1915/1917 synthase